MNSAQILIISCLYYNSSSISLYCPTIQVVFAVTCKQPPGNKQSATFHIFCILVSLANLRNELGSKETLSLATVLHSTLQIFWGHRTNCIGTILSFIVLNIACVHLWCLFPFTNYYVCDARRIGKIELFPSLAVAAIQSLQYRPAIFPYNLQPLLKPWYQLQEAMQAVCS